MTTTLAVLLAGTPIGTVERDARGRHRFRYDATWQAQAAAIPLSLSMPLIAREHPDKAITPFLWNLLPDNERILQRWAAEFHVSARNPFALLAETGEDCAGAVQFVAPDRLDALLAAPSPPVAWLDEADIAARLKALRSDPAHGRAPGDAGQFSLAGAQPKTALLYQDGCWGIPSGRVPTTHILKPPTGEFAGHAENEHFCLALARRLSLPAATSTVRHFGDETAIVVERFDRRATPGGILRLHQEDLCQALGLPPERKYQNEGGPTPADIVGLLRDHSSRPEEDVATFRDALILNWLIGGSDAHAKNYALLLGAGGQVRLAPLYDVASVLPYPGVDPQAVRLAMAVGGQYRLRDIGPRQWRSLAREARLDADHTLDRARSLAAGVADAAPTIAAAMRQQGMDHPILPRLVALLAERAERCAALLAVGGAATPA